MDVGTKAEFEQLAQKAKGCRECQLWENRTNVVFGEGEIDSRVMLIGEAPGRREDAQGRPFVGRAGQLLDEVLHSAGINRPEMYITNIVKCRPPQNRNPHAREISTCTQLYLNEQLIFMQPRILVTMGNFATTYILEKYGQRVDSISKIHGQVLQLSSLSHSFLVIPVYHPAAAIYNPELKDSLEHDFTLIKKQIISHIK